MADGIYRLEGQIQNYGWGGHEFIPELLGFRPEPHIPYAEYWLGAHAKAPSKIILDSKRSVDLDQFIAAHPQRALGRRAALQHDQLPYLFKVLDVETPLSIQVHPTKPEAEAGFARESALGIPIDSAERNYKDDNHKPELMVALSDFWLLHGFLPEAQLLDVLRTIPEFYVLRGVYEKGGTAALYSHVMNMPSEEVDAILRPLVQRIRRKADSDGWQKSCADYWVARVVSDRTAEHYDRGVFSIYLFNLVHLTTGQAIFQDAGIPHAYLQGQNIEVMANSDNVLRGGLTEKHVDVSELLRIVRFEGICPAVLEGTLVHNPLEIFFESPTRDFLLSRIDLGPGDAYINSARSLETLLLIDGAAAVENGQKCLPLDRGQSAVVFGGSKYRITAMSGQAVLFRVSVP